MNDTPKADIGLLKKISTRTVFGGRGEILELVMKDRTKKIPIYRVWGEAIGTRSAESREKGDDGEKIKSTGLVGEINAINLHTGEQFYSTVCWLPQMAVDLVATQFGGDTDDVQRVAFAYDIGAQFDESSATSYTFTVDPLTELKPTESMQKLTASLPPLPKPLTAIADKSKG